MRSSSSLLPRLASTSGMDLDVLPHMCVCVCICKVFLPCICISKIFLPYQNLNSPTLNEKCIHSILGHYLDQKRLKQGLYRHPWDDISYVLPEHMSM